MDNQPGQDYFPTGDKAKTGISTLEHLPAQAWFTEDESLYGLEAVTFQINPISDPEKSTDPEIDAEEIESVYLWFYS